jgi:hypothetical protein
VNRSRAASLLGGFAIAAALLGASAASAATLVGDYQFQGTRASSGAGPELTDIAAGNTFQTDTVMGSSRQVLAFPQHSGLQMTPSVGSGSVPFSVVTTFRLDNVSSTVPTSYRRILDQSNTTLDAGFYTYQGMADYFGDSIDEVTSPSVVFADNVYATVAITSLPPTASLIYVNGTQVVTAPETLPVVADTLRFFKDDGSPSAEESAGAVSCIRVYSGALTDAEVSAIGASATCQAPATIPTAQPQPTPKKKCKKHKKKKRSAESAKKKKCKKKRKR